MDAHTLNAWTRFALQKGGIGSCTALIDNPATDLEDLMFMAGEKIVVLRRLDDDATTSESGRSRSGSGDASSWYLGYCEGVVGRFKGAHVQFHGKLKKPVLMRRSGVGAIRESTLRPMSKSDAANLHASQVPPGIPVTAIDSDDDETEGKETGRRNSGSLQAATSQQAAESPTTPLNKTVGSRLAQLGVTTPPLSDESHARQANTASQNNHRGIGEQDSDSDDESDTHLPWARASITSNSGSNQVHSSDSSVRGDMRRQSLVRGGPLGGRVANLHMNNTLPPSPISSAESPLTSKAGDHGLPSSTSFEGVIPRVRAPGLGHTPNQSSTSTMTTSESEEDARRPDHTLSIYEIYGRDSVAFPNFDFRALNGKTSSLSARITPSKSSDSLNVSRSTPTSPLMLNDSNSSARPVALRTPSHRRPTAAPPVPNVSASLRRKGEAGDNSGQSSNTGNANGAFGAFDPRRRPSMGNPNGLRTRGPMTSTDGGNAAQRDSNGRENALVPPMPSSVNNTASNSGRPIGSNLLARRMQESDVGNMAPRLNAGDVSSMRIDTTVGTSSQLQRDSANLTSPNKPFAMVVEGALPSPSAVTYRPSRSSSDRTSHRERIGSGQLKKNPSNPQPGLHGGLSALMIPSSSNQSVGMSTPSRSPSPLSAASPIGSGSIMRPYSPGGALSASPNHAPGESSASPTAQQALSPTRQGPASPMMSSGPIPQRMMRPVSPAAPYQNINPANVAFDQLGFVVGSTPPIAVPREDPEALKAWRQVLTENDLTAAKKSRKVKKMAQCGIPHSVRAAVWPFLANAYIRRRVGLFEELCKMSGSAKGKKGKEALYDAVEKDMDRAYPDHRLFMGAQSTGSADLEAILKAYVHYNPTVGYTQGMNLVAGFLLIQMPAEDAFWLLCALLRDVHMEGYYAGDMKQLHVDGIVFGQLLQSMDPDLAARLIELNVEPINFAPNWILPLFARVLPWQTLLRVWDVFFFEGPSWILRVALAIIRILRDPLMDRRVCPGPGEALRLLLHPPQHLLTPDNVIPCAMSVKLKDGEVRKLSRQASKLVRNTVLSPAAARGRAASFSNPSVARSASAPPVKRQHATTAAV